MVLSALSVLLACGWIVGSVPLAALVQAGSVEAFVGTWVLDTLLSDHPEQIATAPRLDTWQDRAEEFSGSVPDSNREAHP